MLSVIILNWNGRKVMEEFLPSVVKYTTGDEVELIVADNGSTDDSVEWLEREFPQIRLIKFPENYGFAGGYDRAIREVNTEFTLLLNSDVEVTPDWWRPLLSFMKSHPQAGGVQPKILSYRHKDTFEHAGAAGGLLDRMGYPYCRGRVMSRVEPDQGQYDSNEAIRIAWASGAALLLRTKAYIEAGGLDEKFFAHMEEIDLCWRMMLKGYGIFSLSSSVVYHLGGGALAYGNPRKTYLNFRNNLLMLHKNLPRREGKRKLLLRRLADTLGFMFFLLQGKWKHARAVLKAHGDFRKMKREYNDFPSKNIFKEIPGTSRYIYLDFLLGKKPHEK